LTLAELTILQPGDPFEPIAGPVGLLFECAPDSQARRRNPDALALQELIGHFDAVKHEASDLTTRLLAGEPRLRGIAQLRIFEEGVIRELQHVFHTLHLSRRLSALGIRRCRFLKASRFAQRLVDLNRDADFDLEVAVLGDRPRPPIASSLANSWQRVTQARFSASSVRGELGLALNRVDPFRRRRALLPRPVRKRGGTWFYSSAYTFTQIGLFYEPYFPTPFEFLVENPATGGRPLTESGRQFVDAYEFTSWGDAPTKREVRDAVEALTAHLHSIPLEGDDALARKILLRSAYMRTFLDRLLPLGLFSTTLFERWIERVRPDTIIVGNPVFEGYALHAARRGGIPTILLQHGILGDFCQFVDPPADHYVVRGEFWKEFLAPAARRRASVLNPGSAAGAEDTGQPVRTTLVFVSAPYSTQEFYHKSDLDEILGVLIAAAHETGRELVIRVHPLERVAYYQTLAGNLLSRMPSGPQVSYSQGPGLDDVLSRATVAVTFSSTVFLDCLRHGVPILSFDWHEFSYRNQIERSGAFRFARDLSHLRMLIRDAVAGRLPPFSKNIEPFLAASAVGILRAELARLTRSQPPACCP
jgi:hypothetical protein